MLRLIEGGIRATQAGTAAAVASVVGLEEYERRAFQRFLENPNGRNVNTLATYASTESPLVEGCFDSLPDSVVWKDGGKWHILVPA